MVKTLSVLSVIVAAGLYTSTEASARMGLSFNGVSVNGASANGRNLNGMSFNGRNLNGRNLNGSALKGADREEIAAGQGAQATTVILQDGARVSLK